MSAFSQTDVGHRGERRASQPERAATIEGSGGPVFLPEEDSGCRVSLGRRVHRFEIGFDVHASVVAAPHRNFVVVDELLEANYVAVAGSNGVTWLVRVHGADHSEATARAAKAWPPNGPAEYSSGPIMVERDRHDLVLSGGRVIDPSLSIDDVLDVRIRDGHIAEIGERLRAGSGERRIDVSGLVVAPGLVDVHVHFREPGQEHKETIETGSRSAAAGGFTSVCVMPNTSPTNDSVAVMQLIRARAAEVGLVNVFPVGAITKGLAGEELTPIGALARNGAVAISDDGHPVMNGQLMRRAMEWAAEIGIPVIDHCEDRNLAAGGVVNEGCCAARLGLKGMNRIAEEVQVVRDCLLAEVTGAHVHIAHLSSARSLEFVRDAKARGVRVTCEVTPHHFSLTEEAIAEFDTGAKMNPPLRTGEDVSALLAGLADGTVDCIATDHAPHHADEKALEFERAPFGIVGLETSLAIGITHLVDTGRITLARLVELMSLTPSRLFRLGRGTLVAGSPADIVCFDPAAEFVVDAERFSSLGRNTPYQGHHLKGRVALTVLGGTISFQASETLAATTP